MDDTDLDAWPGVFDGYDAIVLVANSEEALATDMHGFWPGKTLFVFFNDARRVLKPGFDHDAILVLRSGRQGPSVIRRGRLGPVVGHFAPGRLKSILNLVVDGTERRTDLASQADHAIVPMDLTAYFAGRYTGGKIPSSGYALAVWLSDVCHGRQVVLCGFNALRSESWKVFDIHDWGFEQTSLRLLKKQGRVAFNPDPSVQPGAIQALQAQYPDVGLADLVAMHAEVLSERLEHTNGFVDRLWSVTRFSRLLRTLLQFGRSRP